MSRGTTEPSRFIKLGPCDACGSSDANAEYSDHSFCFSCRHTIPKNKAIQRFPNRISSNSESGFGQGSVISELARSRQEQPQEAQRNTPWGKNEETHTFPAEPTNWLTKYDITTLYPTAWKMLFFYHPLRHFLGWYVGTNFVQTREFSSWEACSNQFTSTPPKPNKSRKYLSYGQRPGMAIWTNYTAETAKISQDTPIKTIVLVEDFISALKLCAIPGVLGVPCFGTSINHLGLNKGVLSPYEEVKVWWDRDAADKGSKALLTLSKWHSNCRQVVTNHDPKVYGLEAIQKHLGGK